MRRMESCIRTVAALELTRRLEGHLYDSFLFHAIVGNRRTRNKSAHHRCDSSMHRVTPPTVIAVAPRALVHRSADAWQLICDRDAIVEILWNDRGSLPVGQRGGTGRNPEMVQANWFARRGAWRCPFIDEINLLPDHLADHILDSAASGRYRMERDGVHRSVESRYILVGTMNRMKGISAPSSRIASRTGF